MLRNLARHLVLSLDTFELKGDGPDNEKEAEAVLIGRLAIEGLLEKNLWRSRPGG